MPWRENDAGAGMKEIQPLLSRGFNSISTQSQGLGRLWESFKSPWEVGGVGADLGSGTTQNIPKVPLLPELLSSNISVWSPSSFGREIPFLTRSKPS